MSLVCSADVRPRVFHRTIQVGPVIFDVVPERDELVAVPGDGLSLTASANDFYPLVRFEVRSERPARPAGPLDYDRTFHGRLATSLGVYDLNGVEYGSVRVREGKYRVRVTCRGRDHPPVETILEPFPPEGPHADPLEVWVIQVWPDP